MIGIDLSIDAARTMDKRILWVCERYFPFMSPIEWSLYGSICAHKNLYGQAVVSSSGEGMRVFDGITIIDKENHLRANLMSGLRQLHPHHVVCHSSLAADVFDFAADAEVKVAVKISESSFQDHSLSSLFEHDLQFFCEEPWITHAAHTTWGISPILVRPIVVPWVTVANYKAGRRRLLYCGRRSSPAYRAINEVARSGNCSVAVLSTPESSELFGRSQMFNAIYCSADAMVLDAEAGDCVSYLVLGAILNKIPVVTCRENREEEWNQMVIQVDDMNDERAWVSRIRDALSPEPRITRDRLREYSDAVSRQWSSVNSYNAIF